MISQDPDFNSALLFNVAMMTFALIEHNLEMLTTSLHVLALVVWGAVNIVTLMIRWNQYKTRNRNRNNHE